MDNLQFNGNGNGRYSAKTMAKPINFLCIAPEAQEVCVIGDFNEWDGNSHAMNRHFDGSWSTQIDLHHGHHRNQFLIDGKPSLDPRANGVVRNERTERGKCLNTVERTEFKDIAESVGLKEQPPSPVSENN